MLSQRGRAIRFNDITQNYGVEIRDLAVIVIAHEVSDIPKQKKAIVTISVMEIETLVRPPTGTTRRS